MSRRNDDDLERYFASLRDPDYGDSFEDTRRWLRQVEARRRSRLHGSRLRVALDYVRARPTRFAVSGVVLALVVIACTVPVTEERTIGYMLSGGFRPESADEVMADFRSLAWATNVRWGTVFEDSTDVDLLPNVEWFTFHIPLPDARAEDAELRLSQLETVAGVAWLEMRPMTIAVERPLYEAALPPVLRPRGWSARLRLSESARDDEIERVIDEHVARLHAHEVTAEIVHGERGARELVLSSPTWESLWDEGLEEIELFRREVEAYVAEEVAIGFAVSGRFPATREANDVMRRTTDFAQAANIRRFQYGTIWEGGIVQSLSVEMRLPGVSREEAEAVARDLEVIDGISDVEVKTIEQAYADLGFTLTARFRPTADVNFVHSRLRDMSRQGIVRYVRSRRIRDGEHVRWIVFNMRLPGASPQDAEAQARELLTINGIMDVELKSVGRE